jgi:hypothetical protein
MLEHPVVLTTERQASRPAQRHLFNTFIIIIPSVTATPA